MLFHRGEKWAWLVTRFQSQIPASVPRTANSNRSSLIRSEASILLRSDDARQHVGDRFQKLVLGVRPLMSVSNVQVDHAEYVIAGENRHAVVTVRRHSLGSGSAAADRHTG